ncbi:hypothetical protein QYF36_004511 [Acer negundo]|nr:hypothetical protein QYF36_004511 [Acer negundo]
MPSQFTYQYLITGSKKTENKWLSSLASDPPSELNVLGHDSDSLSVNGTQISVFKQTHQIRLSCLLKSSHYAALEPHIGLKILSNLSHKSLERKLPYQKLCALLVLSYLSQRHRSGFETVRLLHSSGFRSRFPGSFGGQLLTWRFAYVGLPCRMLHADLVIRVKRDQQCNWFTEVWIGILDW